MRKLYRGLRASHNAKRRSLEAQQDLQIPREGEFDLTCSTGGSVGLDGWISYWTQIADRALAECLYLIEKAGGDDERRTIESEVGSLSHNAAEASAEE
jgi:hypothetical protein